MKPHQTAAAAVSLAALAIFASGRSLPQVAPSPSPTPDAEALPRKACSGCHLFPPPDVLPRDAWAKVVLDMTSLIVDHVGVPKGAPAPTADFDIGQIIEYYESRAPRTLPSPAPWPAPGQDPERFARHAFSPVDLPAASPAVSNVRFLPLSAGAPPQLIASDMISGLVLAGDPRDASGALRLLGRVANPCHVEAVDLDKDGLVDLVVADLGGVQPGDHTRGTVTWLRRLAEGGFKVIPLATGLPRVADVQVADFDGDGRLDLLVGAFGWRKVGGIYLLENRTTDWKKPLFVKRELDERAGAIHVPVVDLNGDGRPDFVALLSQQHETVVAFLNDGSGGFRKEVIDQAPHPAWGSSGLQLVDLDGDGDLDVLVTNGDMLDDFRLKPYHGIRWLENRGAYPFVPHDVAPMFGVMRAQAADIDGDGRMDIVACALVQFTLGGEPPQSLPDVPSLVWLRQTAPGVFERHALERGAQHVSLDLGDYDGDGDVDIAVGNFRSEAKSFVEIWENLRIKR